MLNLKELKKPIRHPLRPVFKGYALSRLAVAVSTHPTYFQNVMLGHVKASVDLESRILALADEIQKAEAAPSSLKTDSI